MTNWNELAAQHHAAMVANGFHEKYSHADLLLRGIQEAGELASAWRKNRRADMILFGVDLQIGVPFEEAYGKHIKYSMEEEVADIILILMDFCATNRIEMVEKKHLFSYTKDIPKRLLWITARFVRISELCGAKEGDECYVEYWDKTRDYTIEILSLLLRICEIFSIDLEQQVKLKMQYNSTRPWKHGDKN